MTMKRDPDARLEGRFLHLVYSPRGEIEGVLIETARGAVQVVFDHHDPDAAVPFVALRAGQSVSLSTVPAVPSPKGRGEHPVHGFRELLAIDEQPLPAADAGGAAYRGRVRRYNYARHGAINGVVLDSGDFLHLKPEGHAALGLAIGDAVEADGDAHRLADGSGWAVEATTVNGQAVRRH